MKHILVVEDDPINAMLFRKLLEKRGDFRVSVTERAEEVVEWSRSGQVDVVIMDVSLPNTRWEGRPTGGVELCRLLKSDPLTRSIPVILATAHAMRGDAESLLAESHADDYVSKPVLDHGRFIQQVRGLTEKAA